MLVIRLQRVGRENTPAYRIVLSEKARHVQKGTQEIFGHFLPAQKNPVFECNQERVAHWIGKGAIPSNTLARLLNRAGMKNMEKYFIKYTKRRPKGEQPPAPVAAAPAAPAAEAKKEEKAEEKPAA